MQKVQCMADPWAFGWTQLLTIFGLIITVIIASSGFRSFERWRTEKLEERRIDVALEALGLAHEAKYVFESIRSPMSQSYESKDMQRWQGETDEQYQAREPFFAILARIDRNKDFFERLFKLQPRFMALFGADKEDIFMKCHTSRRMIEVSATMLMKTASQGGSWNENRLRQRSQWECDIWEGMDTVDEDLPNARRVTKGIKDFQDGIIRVCRPIAERKKNYGHTTLVHLE